MSRLKIAFAAASVWLILGGSTAISETITITDDPMVVGGGARPLGMGRAFTAVAEDVDALFINPAGIAGLKGPQAMAMFTNLLGDIYYTEFCGAVPSRLGTLGIGCVVTGVSHVLIPVDSTPVYSDYYDSLFILSYSSPLSRFLGYGREMFFGANFKIFSRGWSGGVTKSALGYSLDIGLKYVYTPYLSFGFSRQNLLPLDLGGVLRWQGSGAEEAIAGLYKLGIAVKPKPLQGKVLMAFDVDLPAYSGRPVTMHAGGEWRIREDFAIRAGLDQSVDAAAPSQTSWNPTVGSSLTLFGFRVDYAFHAYYNDPALATSYISFSYQWAPLFALSGEAR